MHGCRKTVENANYTKNKKARHDTAYSIRSHMRKPSTHMARATNSLKTGSFFKFLSVQYNIVENQLNYNAYIPPFRTIFQIQIAFYLSIVVPHIRKDATAHHFQRKCLLYGVTVSVIGWMHVDVIQRRIVYLLFSPAIM